MRILTKGSQVPQKGFTHGGEADHIPAVRNWSADFLQNENID